MELINLKNFSLCVNKEFIVKNLSFSIESNRIYGIKAENGSGKTSILDVICNTFHSSQDYSYIGEITKKDSLKLSRVFQEPRFIESISVEKNICLSAEKKSDKNNVFFLMEKLNISDCYKKTPGQLSGGQLQRASIARALLHNFDLLLLDEPFSFQDKENRENIIDFIKDFLNKEKKSCIIISHNDEDFAMLNAELINIKSNNCK